MKTLIKNIFNPARSIKVKEFPLASCILSLASRWPTFIPFLLSFICLPALPVNLPRYSVNSLPDKNNKTRNGELHAKQ